MRKITLTDEYKEQLFLIPLFRDLPLNIKHSLLDRLDISVYEVNKKDIIATQGTLCKNYTYCWKENCGSISSMD